MRITIVTVGSRGDVEPYIPLGLGLQRAGHEVALATHASFESVIRARGLGFFTLHGNPREILDSDEGQAWLKSGGNPLAFLSRMSQLMGPPVVDMLNDISKACQSADAVIYSVLGGLGAYHVVQKLNIRFLPAFLQPSSPTGAFPSPSFPIWLPLGSGYNRLTYTLSEQFLWHLLKNPLNRARAEVLGLPPMSRAWFAGGDARRIPILYGYSQTVVPRPPDWGDWLHVTGYWFLDPPADWRPPEKLVDFLASGPPPVCVGFGSMKDRDRERITDIVLKALDLAKVRGVLVTGWGGLSNTDLPDEVFTIEDIPYRWLFPHMAAVAHHAGAGTTAAGIRAGVPTIAVPFFADQPFWARQVHRLGVGPKPIPRKHLSAERLAEAIRAATTDAGIRSRASSVGDRVRAENGVDRAVELFDHLIGK